MDAKRKISHKGTKAQNRNSREEAQKGQKTARVRVTVKWYEIHGSKFVLANTE
jgi:hypothetical protein